MSTDLEAWRRPRPPVVPAPLAVEMVGPYLPPRLVPRQDQVPSIARGRPTHAAVTLGTVFGLTKPLAEWLLDQDVRLNRVPTCAEVMHLAGLKFLPPIGARVRSVRERVPDPAQRFYDEGDRAAEKFARGGW